MMLNDVNRVNNSESTSKSSKDVLTKTCIRFNIFILKQYLLYAECWSKGNTFFITEKYKSKWIEHLNKAHDLHFSTFNV